MIHNDSQLILIDFFDIPIGVIVYKFKYNPCTKIGGNYFIPKIIITFFVVFEDFPNENSIKLSLK